MNPNSDQSQAALRTVRAGITDWLSRGTVDYAKMREDIDRLREFNRNWDQEILFYVRETEDWMEAVPAVWTMRMPSPHPIFEHWVERHGAMLAEQRRLGGREAAYLTNSIREKNKFNQLIVVSRTWLLIALTYKGKVGSDEFWEVVLDEVVRELPDWAVERDGDRLPPDAKTLRNMISIRLHKRFLKQIVGVKICQDG